MTFPASAPPAGGLGCSPWPRCLAGREPSVRGSISCSLKRSSGRSAVLVLRGEPGIGKSALLEYAARACRGLSGPSRNRGGMGDGAPLRGPASALRGPARRSRTAARATTRRAGDRVRLELRRAARSISRRAGRAELAVRARRRSIRWSASSMTSSGSIGPRRRCSPSWRGAWRRSPSSSCSRSASPSGIEELAGLPELRLGGIAGRLGAKAACVGHRRSCGRARPRPDTRRDARQSSRAARAATRVIRRASWRAGSGSLTTDRCQTRIEASFQRRVQQLPATTQRLLLVAAADPTGEPALLVVAAAEHGHPDR